MSMKSEMLTLWVYEKKDNCLSYYIVKSDYIKTNMFLTEEERKKVPILMMASGKEHGSECVTCLSAEYAIVWEKMQKGAV